MKEFTFHCGASSLVDDNYIRFDVKANGIEEAVCKAYKIVRDSNVMDSGSVDCNMDLKELATELGNMSALDDVPWEPVQLLQELEEIKDKHELICTLEWIVSNYNKANLVKGGN